MKELEEKKICNQCKLERVKMARNNKSGVKESINSVLDVHMNGEVSYQILLENSFERLSEALREIGVEGHKICIVTDSNVESLYLEKVRVQAETTGVQTDVFIFPAGEPSKNLDTVKTLYTHLIERGYDRKDYLLALGGGVVGDLTGFAAATYLRGIRFIQVPTTLLSQIDSSIGGKTGVDFDQYKNMVGAFHMPSLVYINTRTLETLPDEQFASGMGELLKSGLIRNADFYEWTINHMGEILERDPETMRYMVGECCKIKRAVVEKDPHEQGERAILNFGHTIGHAIEKLKNFELTHGACVNLGMVCAAHISWQRGDLDEDDFYEIRDMSVMFDLPISFDSLDPAEIIAATHKDKKMEAGKVKFVLLDKIGHAYVATDVAEKEMLEALNFIRAE